MERHWIETENSLELRSADHAGFWSIRWSGCLPGLYWESSRGQSVIGPILGGLGLTAAGRSDIGQTNQKTLVQVEVVQNRVEMIFLPPTWYETKIRLCWWPTAQGQFDLMTEVSTRSVGLLKGVELGIVSIISDLPETRPVWIEEFHDQNAAMRSIDGREADWIKNQTSFEPNNSSGESNPSSPWSACLNYADHKIKILETVHPDDVSRCFRDKNGKLSRTWTFGYDMERGVVFRGRHRCRLFNNSETFDQTTIDNWQNEFAGQPLPLFG